MKYRICDRIWYRCSNCGWKDSVLALWEDIKPKKCMGKKCNTNFLSEPDKLEITYPNPIEDKQPEKQKKSSKKQSKSKKEDKDLKKTLEQESKVTLEKNDGRESEQQPTE